MAAGDERGRMAAPPAHRPGRGDAHWPVKETLAALAARDDAVGAEQAPPAAVEPRERAQLIVGPEAVAHEAVRTAHHADVLDEVRRGSNAHERTLAFGKARQRLRSERPFLARIRGGPGFCARRGEEPVVAA